MAVIADPVEQARLQSKVLIESLPYLREYHGETVVIKYGGHAMTDPQIKEKVISDIILMRYIGINPVIVHGGGPEISSQLAKNGVESRFVDGLRVTDKETMRIAQMVLVGKINQELVALIEKLGGKAVGFSGVDGNMITAKKLYLEKDGQKVDLGFVGEVEKVQTDLIDQAVANGYIPVIAPIGCDENGEVYNINADYAAGSIAAGIGADKLFMLTDIDGVLDKDKKRISLLTFADMEEKIKDGTIQGGMIPKVECCRSAINKGVRKVHIVNGTTEHSILLELFTDKGIGTMVVKEWTK